MFPFQNLLVYKKALYFHTECKSLVSKVPIENYLRLQLLRASSSIVLNIAEGSGRFSKADRKNFFVISRGSVFECVAALDLMKNEMTEEQYLSLQSTADQLSRILFATIRGLQGN